VTDQTFEHYLGVIAGRFRCSLFSFAVGTIEWRPLLVVSIGGSTQTHGIAGASRWMPSSSTGLPVSTLLMRRS